MGIVAKIKKAARSKVARFSPHGLAYQGLEGARHRFERHTSLGKAIRNLYHPTYSAGSYASSVYGHTGSIVGRF